MKRKKERSVKEREWSVHKEEEGNISQKISEIIRWNSRAQHEKIEKDGDLTKDEKNQEEMSEKCGYEIRIKIGDARRNER